MGRALGICNSLSITRTLGDSMSETNNTAPARKTANQFRGQSAAAPSPFPPIADYAFLQLSHRRARGTRWGHRLALRAPLRRAEHVRQLARPGGRRVSVRA